MKCLSCKKEGEIRVEVGSFCKECFIRYYERKVERIVKKFKMIVPGDRVLVAVSGGKDSSSCLFLLSKLKKKIGFELEALYIDLGMEECTNPRTEAIVKKLCRQLEVKLNILRMKEIVEKGIKEVARERRRPVCSVCGVVKRYLMNKYTREWGFNKLATGHNADDIVRFFFKNWLSGNLEWIAKLKPIVPSTHPKLVTRIRPLFECTEKENYAYASIRGFHFVSCTRCSYMLRKDKWREILEFLEKKRRGFKISFVKNLEKLEMRIPEKKLRECEVCGEPTNLKICSFCKMFRQGGKG